MSYFLKPVVLIPPPLTLEKLACYNFVSLFVHVCVQVCIYVLFNCVCVYIYKLLSIIQIIEKNKKTIQTYLFVCLQRFIYLI